jgi:hypothetical protein
MLATVEYEYPMASCNDNREAIDFTLVVEYEVTFYASRYDGDLDVGVDKAVPQKVSLWIDNNSFGEINWLNPRGDFAKFIEEQARCLSLSDINVTEREALADMNELNAYHENIAAHAPGRI